MRMLNKYNSFWISVFAGMFLVAGYVRAAGMELDSATKYPEYNDFFDTDCGKEIAPKVILFAHFPHEAVFVEEYEGAEDEVIFQKKLVKTGLLYLSASDGYRSFLNFVNSRSIRNGRFYAAFSDRYLLYQSFLI